MPASGQGRVPSAVRTHVPRQGEAGSHPPRDDRGRSGVQEESETTEKVVYSQSHHPVQTTLKQA